MPDRVQRDSAESARGVVSEPRRRDCVAELVERNCRDQGADQHEKRNNRADGVGVELSQQDKEH